MSTIVSDTTPLNYLILIAHIDVLPRLFGKLLVPPAVIAEMTHPHAPAAVSSWAANMPGWAEVRVPHTDLGLRIGRGEDEAISLAVEVAATALLVDDRKARRETERRGVLPIGTLSVLDLADELGLLEFEQAISRLLTTNFHVEGALIQRLQTKIRRRKGA